MDNKKRLAYAIIQFLHEQLRHGGLSSDAQESLEGTATPRGTAGLIAAIHQPSPPSRPLFLVCTSRMFCAHQPHRKAPSIVPSPPTQPDPTRATDTEGSRSSKGQVLPGLGALVYGRPWGWLPVQGTPGWTRPWAGGGC